MTQFSVYRGGLMQNIKVNEKVKTNKIVWVAPSVADHPQANSNTRQNPPICDPSFYIAVTFTVFFLSREFWTCSDGEAARQNLLD